VHGLSNGSNGSDLEWPWTLFIGCRLYQVQSVVHLCSILHDFNWQRARTVPLHQQSFLFNLVYITVYGNRLSVIFSGPQNTVGDHDFEESDDDCPNLPPLADITSKHNKVKPGRIVTTFWYTVVTGSLLCCSCHSYIAENVKKQMLTVTCSAWHIENSKNHKRWWYPPPHRLDVNVLVSMITFCDFCCFRYVTHYMLSLTFV